MAVKIMWIQDFQKTPEIILKSFLGRDLLLSVSSHSTKSDQVSLKVCSDPVAHLSTIKDMPSFTLRI